MKKLQYVIGLQFGDEGKGNTVQYLCKEAIKRNEKPLVVRYCSGPQASHTVYNNKVTHICSSFGSGVLLNVPTYIYNLYEQTFVDPIALKAEYDVLIQKGIKPQLYIDDYCHVITPYHVIANQNDKEALENGTCGCGVWWAKQRSFYLWEYYQENWFIDGNGLNCIREDYNIKKQLELEKAFFEAIDFLKQFRKYPNIQDFDTIIMESSQGLALDGDRGFKPYITPCEIFPHNENDLINPVTFLCNKPEVFLITRTYTTRHGNGYNPIMDDKSFLNLDVFEANKDNLYQGIFKTGILDFDLINKCIQRHCLNNYSVNYNLVVTHCDCLKSIGNHKYFFPFIKDKVINNITIDNIGKFIAEQIDLEFQEIYESWDYKSNFIKI